MVHDFGNFLRVGFRERAAEYGEILREDVDEASVDAPEAGDESVARWLLLFHAEIIAVMRYKFVELFEGAFIEEQFDSLAGAEFAFLVLALATLGAAAGFGFGVAAAEFFEAIVVLGGIGHRLDCALNAKA